MNIVWVVTSTVIWKQEELNPTQIRGVFSDRDTATRFASMLKRAWNTDRYAPFLIEVTETELDPTIPSEE